MGDQGETPLGTPLVRELDGRAELGKAYVDKVATCDPDAARPDDWLDHLALWAARHQEQDGALPLERCVVDVSSPELTGAQLIGAPEMAELGGITASTLRAYISRGNSEVPRPQAVVGGRDQWARAVADDWVESRKRSYQGVGERCPPVTATVCRTARPKCATGSPSTSSTPSTTSPPCPRGGWCATATRSPSPISRASSPGRWAPASTRIVPTEHLGRTVRAAALHDFAETVEMFADDENRKKGAASPAWWHFTLTPSVAKTLD
ncbi:hypothetical protein [Streptomyces violaceus]|uniref:DNA-binding protein n=1 Tax=Streptomyces violaceus TaxID=1936 RepID=A0ABZ1NIV8_STRVL